MTWIECSSGTSSHCSCGCAFSALLNIAQARNQGVSERADDRQQKFPLVSQAKESIRACNKIKIVSFHSVFTSLLQSALTEVRKFAMKFSCLILRKIIKIVATRGQILRHKCTKFDFGQLGELTAFPQTP